MMIANALHSPRLQAVGIVGLAVSLTICAVWVIKARRRAIAKFEIDYGNLASFVFPKKVPPIKVQLKPGEIKCPNCAHVWTELTPAEKDQKALAYETLTQFEAEQKFMPKLFVTSVVAMSFAGFAAYNAFGVSDLLDLGPKSWFGMIAGIITLMIGGPWVNAAQRRAYENFERSHSTLAKWIKKRK